MIPKEEYSNILKQIPITCVDLIILRNKKYLLVKRNTEPAKNIWWTPGGRILKNELVKTAAIRKAKEETGLNCEFVKKLGVAEMIFDKGPFGFGVHSISVACLLNSKIGKISLDKTSDEYKWSDKIENAPEVMKEFLTKAGF